MMLSRKTAAVAAFCFLLSCSGPPTPGLPKSPAPPKLGGDEAGNGGGIGEKNILFVYLNIRAYLVSWLAAQRAGFNPLEVSVVERILGNVEGYPPSEARIAFASERKSPGTFFPDGKAHGVIRSAVTGSKPDSRILINIDHLYVENAAGTIVPIDLSESAAVILDELAHHVEPSFAIPAEHTKLDLLCAKLRAFLQAASETSTPGIDREIQARALNFGGASPRTQLVIFDSRTVVDLTEEITRRARCLRADTKVDGIRITNLHWHLKEAGPFDRRGRKVFHAAIYTFCSPGPDFDSHARSFLPYERIHRANLLVDVPSFTVLRDRRHDEWPPNEEYLNPRVQAKDYGIKVAECKIDPKTERYIVDADCH